MTQENQTEQSFYSGIVAATTEEISAVALTTNKGYVESVTKGPEQTISSCLKAILEEIDVWFAAHFHGNPTIKTTELSNQLSAAREDLKSRITNL